MISVRDPLNTIMTKRFTGLLIISLVVFFSTALAASAGAPGETLVFATPAGFSLQTGESAQIAIRIENVADLWAFDLEVRFNPSLMTVTDIELGPFLDEWLSFDEIDHENGIVAYINAQEDGSEPGFGSGNLIYITVQALSDIEQVHLTITRVELSDRDGWLIPCQIINSGSEGTFNQFLPLILR